MHKNTGLSHQNTIQPLKKYQALNSPVLPPPSVTDLEMWGLTPPPVTEALMSESSSSRPPNGPAANVVRLVRLTFRYFDATPEPLSELHWF